MSGDVAFGLLATAGDYRIVKVVFRIALAIGPNAGQRGNQRFAVERLPRWLESWRSGAGRSNRQVLVHDRDPIAREASGLCGLPVAQLILIAGEMGRKRADGPSLSGICFPQASGDLFLNAKIAARLWPQRNRGDNREDTKNTKEIGRSANWLTLGCGKG
jgi:hypothetical protein